MGKVQNIEIKQFLRDAASFIEASYSAMEMTPPHIYLSAIPFAPKDSLVYQDFSPLCTNVISVETKGIDRHGGDLAMALTGHEGKVNSIAYSLDGLLLTSGSEDGTVRLWDTRTGQETLSPLRSGDGTVTSVAFSPDGGSIASGTSHGPIHIWDVRTGRSSTTPLLGHKKAVSCVAFSPDSKLIASAGADHLVRLWNTESGQLLAAMEGHHLLVNAVGFNAKGSVLFSCSDDGDVRRWDVLTLKQMDTPYSHPKWTPMSMAFASDRSAVAIGIAVTREVRVWDADFESESVSAIKTEATPDSIAFSFDGLYLLTAGANGITSWNWRSGQKLYTIISGPTNTIKCPNNGLNIASASDDRKIYIWTTKISQGSSQNLYAHSSGVNAVALSVDDCTIASASKDGTVGLWNAQSGEAVLPPLLGHLHSVNCVLISPDGRLVVSASADSTIRIWDIATGAPVGEPLQGHDGSINSLAFSPDGMWLASAASDKSVRFWQLSLDAPSVEPPEPLMASQELYSLAYSPDGSLIVAGDLLGDFRAWPTSQDEDRESYLIRSMFVIRIRSVAFSPDGNFIVGAFGSRISAWHARKQHSQLAWELEGHSGAFMVQFSPSGQHIISGANDGSICIWDVETRAIQHRLHAHGAGIRSAFMTPDHLRLVSCSEDETIRAWNLAEVTLPASQSRRGPLSNPALLPRKDGWLVGPSDELLLWVPTDYLNYLVIDGTTLIAKHKVIITVPDGGSCDGLNWTACWRG